MARILRKTDKSQSDIALAVNDLKAYVVAQFRLAQADIAALNTHDTLVGTFLAPGFHNDQSERPGTWAANAADLPTSITLANMARAVYEFHRVDILAHANADTTNALSAPAALDLATTVALANDIKAKFNAHRTQSTIHAANDATNSIATANATDLPSSITLLNAIKTAMTAHCASGPSAKSIRLVQA